MSSESLQRTAAVAALLSLAGCGGEKTTGPGPTPPTVASVEITPAQETLTALGASQQYQAVARDASGNTIAGKTFTWSSSDANVARIDQGRQRGEDRSGRSCDRRQQRVHHHPSLNRRGNRNRRAHGGAATGGIGDSHAARGCWGRGAFHHPTRGGSARRPGECRDQRQYDRGHGDRRIRRRVAPGDGRRNRRGWGGDVHRPGHRWYNRAADRCVLGAGPHRCDVGRVCAGSRPCREC
jgi:hypothetical protein